MVGSCLAAKVLVFANAGWQTFHLAANTQPWPFQAWQTFDARHSAYPYTCKSANVRKLDALLPQKHGSFGHKLSEAGARTSHRFMLKDAQADDVTVSEL